MTKKKVSKKSAQVESELAHTNKPPQAEPITNERAAPGSGTRHDKHAPK